MNAVEFSRAMENFAESMNIPKYDVLCEIEEVGTYALQQPPHKREDFLANAFIQYSKGFPHPLPKGTKSLRRRIAEEEEDQ